MGRYLFRPDLSADIGIGHAMRSLALAERLVARHDDVAFACDPRSTPWVAEAFDARGVTVLPGTWGGDEFVDLVADRRPRSVVIDSYTLDAQVYDAVMGLGVPTLAVVDNEPRGARAHLLLDQNIGSEGDWAPGVVPEDSILLAGLEYALIREQVRSLRPRSAPVARTVPVPRVLAFFGGSDARSIGPEVARMLSTLDTPVEATVITRPDLVRAAAAGGRPAPRAGGSVTLSGPVDNLPELVLDADLVIAAAGSSSWELAALGAATALIPVADNQAASYRRLVAGGAAVGLGGPDELRSDPQVMARRIDDLLGSRESRQRLHDLSWALVDGRGPDRVLEAMDGVRV